jgi:O-antigen/teichoic acid export membrane protein/predicted O-methyltransferase YrrM
MGRDAIQRWSAATAMSSETAVADVAPERAAMSSSALRRNYVTTFLTEVLVIASYLVAFRLVAVHFGQNGFGEYALSRRTLSLISPLAVIGLDVAIARFVAYAMSRRVGREGGYAGAALLIMVVTVGVLSAVLLVFPGFFAELFFGSSSYSSLITPLPIMLVGSGLHVIAYGYLRGRALIQRANVLMALNYAAVPLAAIYLAHDVSEILLFMGIGWMVISTIYLALTRISVENISSHTRELLQFGLPRLPGDFLQLALFALPGILIAHIANVRTAGIVAFGVAALGMVGTALTPVSFVLLPAVSGLFARGWVDQVRQRVIEIVRVAVPILLISIIVLELFAQPVIADYLGPSFTPAVGVLRLMMLGALPWGLYVILKSVVDARYMAPINARNMGITFATFVVAAVASRFVTTAPEGIVAAFVISLYVLGALTVVEVLIIVNRRQRVPVTEVSEVAVESVVEEASLPVADDSSQDRMGRFLLDLEMYLQDTGLLLLPLLSVSVVLLLLGAWAIFGQAVLLVGLTTLLSIVCVAVIVQLDMNRRAQVWNYRQIESLFSIYATLNVAQPLPPMRGWAVSPDFASVVIALIHDVKPTCIVEAGSGVSTLIAGYTLKQEGGGMIVSLEQDKRYADIARANVNRHGLGDFVSVRHAPLKSRMIGSKSWLWYDLDQLEDVKSIDMVIVDGPPGNIQRLARYPALPILADRLSDKAVVVLDDCFRHAEREILARWLRDYAGFTSETVGTEKGTVILRKSDAVPISPRPAEAPFLDFAVTRIQD